MQLCYSVVSPNLPLYTLCPCRCYRGGAEYHWFFLLDRGLHIAVQSLLLIFKMYSCNAMAQQHRKPSIFCPPSQQWLTIRTTTQVVSNLHCSSDYSQAFSLDDTAIAFCIRYHMTILLQHCTQTYCTSIRLEDHLT